MTGRTHRGLRARVVRGLDLAVEFATLGEYGVEEVELAGPAEPSSWDWPGSCGGGRQDRSRSPRQPSRRTRAGSVPPDLPGCAAA